MTARIGIVVVAHAPLASALLATVRGILADVQQVTAIDIDSDAPAADNTARIASGISAVESTAGVLIAADLFGATPANLCLPLLQSPQTELIAGINLPLLLKLCCQWQTCPMADVLAAVQGYVPQTITIRGSHAVCK